ncbi:hypothetical protein [Dysgonomonas termitidis]|uniref:Transcriptional regulator n=1 Tax=Dysgonomonas termitidis TaxID=1516126 RepID=A0ABV9KQ96_9BACT
MKKIDFETVKGKQAKDSISGFEGKITAIAEYIDGYVSVRLTRLTSDGRITEPWFSSDSVDIAE